ncbi:hypothetical protein ISCGN_006887 [Ixodes scapularis]
MSARYVDAPKTVKHREHLKYLVGGFFFFFFLLALKIRRLTRAASVRVGLNQHARDSQSSTGSTFWLMLGIVRELGLILKCSTPCSPDFEALHDILLDANSNV